MKKLVSWLLTFSLLYSQTVPSLLLAQNLPATSVSADLPAPQQLQRVNEGLKNILSQYPQTPLDIETLLRIAGTVQNLNRELEISRQNHNAPFGEMIRNLQETSAQIDEMIRNGMREKLNSLEGSLREAINSGVYSNLPSAESNWKKLSAQWTNLSPSAQTELQAKAQDIGWLVALARSLRSSGIALNRLDPNTRRLILNGDQLGPVGVRLAEHPGNAPANRKMIDRLGGILSGGDSTEMETRLGHLFENDPETHRKITEVLANESRSSTDNSNIRAAGHNDRVMEISAGHLDQSKIPTPQTQSSPAHSEPHTSPFAVELSQRFWKLEAEETPLLAMKNLPAGNLAEPKLAEIRREKTALLTFAADADWIQKNQEALRQSGYDPNELLSRLTTISRLPADQRAAQYAQWQLEMNQLLGRRAGPPQMQSLDRQARIVYNHLNLATFANGTKMSPEDVGLPTDKIDGIVTKETREKQPGIAFRTKDGASHFTTLDGSLTQDETFSNGKKISVERDKRSGSLRVTNADGNSLIATATPGLWALVQKGHEYGKRRIQGGTMWTLPEEWVLDASAMTSIKDPQRRNQRIDEITLGIVRQRLPHYDANGPEVKYEAASIASYVKDRLRHGDLDPAKTQIAFLPNGSLIIDESLPGGAVRETIGKMEETATGWSDGVNKKPIGFTIYARQAKDAASLQSAPAVKVCQYLGNWGREEYLTRVESNTDEWWSFAEGANVQDVSYVKRTYLKPDGTYHYRGENITKNVQVLYDGPGILGATGQAVDTSFEGLADIIAAGGSAALAQNPLYLGLVKASGGDVDAAQKDLMERAKVDFFGNAISKSIGDYWLGDSYQQGMQSLNMDTSRHRQNVMQEVTDMGHPILGAVAGGMNDAGVQLLHMVPMVKGLQILGNLSRTGMILRTEADLYFQASLVVGAAGSAADLYTLQDQLDSHEGQMAVRNFTSTFLNLVAIPAFSPKGEVAAAKLEKPTEIGLPKSLDFANRDLFTSRDKLGRNDFQQKAGKTLDFLGKSAGLVDFGSNLGEKLGNFSDNWNLFINRGETVGKDGKPLGSWLGNMIGGYAQGLKGGKFGVNLQQPSTDTRTETSRKVEDPAIEPNPSKLTPSSPYQFRELDEGVNQNEADRKQEIGRTISTEKRGLAAHKFLVDQVDAANADPAGHMQDMLQRVSRAAEESRSHGTPLTERVVGSFWNREIDVQSIRDCVGRAIFNNPALRPVTQVFSGDYSRFLDFLSRETGNNFNDSGLSYDRERLFLNKLGLELEAPVPPSNSRVLIDELRKGVGGIRGDITYMKPIGDGTFVRIAHHAIIIHGAFAEEGIWHFVVVDSNAKTPLIYTFDELRAMGIEISKIGRQMDPVTRQPYTDQRIFERTQAALDRLAHQEKPSTEPSTRILAPEFFGKIRGEPIQNDSKPQENPSTSKVIADDAKFKGFENLKDWEVDARLHRMYPGNQFFQGLDDINGYFNRLKWRQEAGGRPIPGDPGGPPWSEVDSAFGSPHLPPNDGAGIIRVLGEGPTARTIVTELPANGSTMGEVNMYASDGKRIGALSFTVSENGKKLSIGKVQVDSSVQRQGINKVLIAQMIQNNPGATRISNALYDVNGHLFWENYDKTKDYYAAIRATPAYKARVEQGFTEISPPPDGWQEMPAFVPFEAVRPNEAQLNKTLAVPAIIEQAQTAIQGLRNWAAQLLPHHAEPFAVQHYFDQETFQKLHPQPEGVPIYHGMEHSLQVAQVEIDFARARGLAESDVKFLGEVALLHDIDPTRKPGTPARVPETLQRLEMDFSGELSLDGRPGHSVLKERFGWDEAKFKMAKTMIQRTEFPLDSTNENPYYAKISPEERYRQMLAELPPGDRRFVLREGALLSEYADKSSHYSIENFDGAVQVVQGFAGELNTAAGKPVTDLTKLNTYDFLSKVGAKGWAGFDEALAREFGIEDFHLPDRTQAFSLLPEHYGRTFEMNLHGFEALQNALGRGESIPAAIAEAKEKLSTTHERTRQAPIPEIAKSADAMIAAATKEHNQTILDKAAALGPDHPKPNEIIYPESNKIKWTADRAYTYAIDVDIGKYKPIREQDFQQAVEDRTLFPGILTAKFNKVRPKECTLNALANNLASIGHPISIERIHDIISRHPNLGPQIIKHIQGNGLTTLETLRVYSAVIQTLGVGLETVPADRLFETISQNGRGAIVSIRDGRSTHAIYVEGIAVRNGDGFVSMLDSNMKGRTYMPMDGFAQALVSGGLMLKPERMPTPELARTLTEFQQEMERKIKETTSSPNKSESSSGKMGADPRGNGERKIVVLESLTQASDIKGLKVEIGAGKDPLCKNCLQIDKYRDDFEYHDGIFRDYLKKTGKLLELEQLGAKPNKLAKKPYFITQGGIFADAQALPLKDKSVSLILSKKFYWHDNVAVPEIITPVLQSYQRVLKNDGKIVLLNNVHEGFKKTDWTLHKEIARKLGFNVSEIELRDPVYMDEDDVVTARGIMLTKPSGIMQLFAGGSVENARITLDKVPEEGRRTAFATTAEGKEIALTASDRAGRPTEDKESQRRALLREKNIIQDVAQAVREGELPANFLVTRVLGLGTLDANLAEITHQAKGPIPIIVAERSEGLSLKEWLNAGIRLNLDDWNKFTNGIKKMHEGLPSLKGDGLVYSDAFDENTLVTQDAAGHQFFRLLDWELARRRSEMHPDDFDVMKEWDIEALNRITDSFREKGLLSGEGSNLKESDHQVTPELRQRIYADGFKLGKKTELVAARFAAEHQGTALPYHRTGNFKQTGPDCTACALINASNGGLKSADLDHVKQALGSEPTPKDLERVAGQLGGRAVFLNDDFLFPLHQGHPIIAVIDKGSKFWHTIVIDGIFEHEGMNYVSVSDSNRQYRLFFPTKDFQKIMVDKGYYFPNPVTSDMLPERSPPKDPSDPDSMLPKLGALAPSLDLPAPSKYSTPPSNVGAKSWKEIAWTSNNLHRHYLKHRHEFAIRMSKELTLNEYSAMAKNLVRQGLDVLKQRTGPESLHIVVHQKPDGTSFVIDTRLKHVAIFRIHWRVEIISFFIGYPNESVPELIRRLDSHPTH